MDRDELKKWLTVAWDSVREYGMKGGIRSPETVYVTALLGFAVLELDRTSGELATANNKLERVTKQLTLALVVLAVVQIVIAVVQVILMVRGH